MKIEFGIPAVEGRYIVFQQCASRQVPDWCEPAIATWHGGRWHSSGPIYGWIGPIPLAKPVNLLNAGDTARKAEYDL